jgi:parvulin-like peptidyl-prolyl isomerase
MNPAPTILFIGLILSEISSALLAQDVTKAKEIPLPAAKRPGGIVAIVGDDVITQNELDERLERKRIDLTQRYSPSVVEAEIPRLSYWLLDQMIDDKLILALVKKDEEKEGKPSITEADLDAEIKRQLERLPKKGLAIAEPEDLYRVVLERDHMTREQYRAFMKDKLAINKYLWQKVFQPGGGYASPHELRSYYLNHLDEFTNPVEISFRQIDIPPARSNAAIVEQVEKALKSAAPFTDVAKQVAEALGGDPGSAGRLIKKSFEELKDYSAPIRETLRRMKKGEVSDRVVTESGIHWYQVEDVVEGKPKTYAEVQPEIEERIREEYNQAELDSFLAKLHKKKRIQRFLPPLQEPRTSKEDEKQPAKESKGGEGAEKGEKPAKKIPAPTPDGGREATPEGK